MNAHKFLITSALYLALAGSTGLAGAADTATKTLQGDSRTLVAKGDNMLRFTVSERRTLEQYSRQQAAGQPASRVDDEDDEDDGGRSRGHGHGHGQGQQKSLPPGLQKKADRGGELPPGWQRKLARGKVVPPDIYGRAQPLPADVRQALPPDPPGTVTVNIDGEIVRVYQATRQIADILHAAR